MKLAAILIWFPALPLSATDLLRVLPVTDEILMLHFKEGHIDYNGVRPDGSYEPQTENRVCSSKLIEPAALTNSTLYRISSPDDPAYGAERPPVALGFKAKGTEFNGPDRQPPYLREYWVYAVLPKQMQSGKTYTVHVGDLAENLNESGGGMRMRATGMATRRTTSCPSPCC